MYLKMSISNWVSFFKDAGVASSVALTYATAFVRNSIGSDTLEDLDKEDLREMGISAIGDMKRILKHVKKLDKNDILLKYNDFGISQIVGCLKTEDIKREEDDFVTDLDENRSRLQVPNPLFWGPGMRTQVEVEDPNKEQSADGPTRADPKLPKGSCVASRLPFVASQYFANTHEQPNSQNSEPGKEPLPTISCQPSAMSLNEMPFQCPKCPAAFGLENDLKKHRERCVPGVLNMTSVETGIVEISEMPAILDALPQLSENYEITDKDMNEGTASEESPTLTESMPIIINVEGAHEMESDVGLGFGVTEACGHEDPKESRSAICDENGDKEEQEPTEDTDSMSLIQEIELQHDDEEDSDMVNKYHGMSDISKENKCDICNKIYTVKSSSKFPEALERCDSCMYRNYRLHQTSWRDACKFACKSCPEKTSRRSVIIKHNKKRHRKDGSAKTYRIVERNEHECLLCKRNVMQESVTLNNHMLKSHGINLPTYERRHFLPSLKGAEEQFNVIDKEEVITRADFEVDIIVTKSPKKDRDAKDLRSKESVVDSEIRSRRESFIKAQYQIKHNNTLSDEEREKNDEEEQLQKLRAIDMNAPSKRAKDDDCDSDISDVGDVGYDVKSAECEITFMPVDSTEKEDEQKECFICGKKKDISCSRNGRYICEPCKQRKIKSILAPWRNACKFSCNYCPEVKSSRFAMMKHCRTAHHKDYSARHYRLLEGPEHMCLLCKRSVLQDSKRLNDHMLKNHKMNLATYEEKYFFPGLKAST